MDPTPPSLLSRGVTDAMQFPACTPARLPHRFGVDRHPTRHSAHLAASETPAYRSVKEGFSCDSRGAVPTVDRSFLVVTDEWHHSLSRQSSVDDMAAQREPVPLFWDGDVEEAGDPKTAPRAPKKAGSARRHRRSSLCEAPRLTLSADDEEWDDDVAEHHHCHPSSNEDDGRFESTGSAPGASPSGGDRLRSALENLSLATRLSSHRPIGRGVDDGDVDAGGVNHRSSIVSTVSSKRLVFDDDEEDGDFHAAHDDQRHPTTHEQEALRHPAHQHHRRPPSHTYRGPRRRHRSDSDSCEKGRNTLPTSYDAATPVSVNHKPAGQRLDEFSPVRQRPRLESSLMLKKAEPFQRFYS